MKKISAIFLSLILIFCFSITSFAATYTGIDGMSIDIPDSYEYVDSNNDEHSFANSENKSALVIKKQYLDADIETFKDPNVLDQFVEANISTIERNPNYCVVYSDAKIVKQDNGLEAIVLTLEMEVDSDGRIITHYQNMLIYFVNDYMYLLNNSTTDSSNIFELEDVMSNVEFTDAVILPEEETKNDIENKNEDDKLIDTSYGTYTYTVGNNEISVEKTRDGDIIVKENGVELSDAEIEERFGSKEQAYEEIKNKTSNIIGSVFGIVGIIFLIAFVIFIVVIIIIVVLVRKSKKKKIAQQQMPQNMQYGQNQFGQEQYNPYGSQPTMSQDNSYTYPNNNYPQNNAYTNNQYNQYNQYGQNTMNSQYDNSYNPYGNNYNQQ